VKTTTRPYAAAPAGARTGAVATAVAAALALAVGGCTGSSSDQPAGSPTSSSRVSPSSSVTPSSAGPTPTTPSTPTAQGAESAAAATAALTKVLTDQAAAAAKPGADGLALRQGVYAAEALTAATARGRLVSTLTADQKADLALNPADAVVLAVSRGTAYPRSIVAKSATAKTGQFVLLLLNAADAATGYRIIHQTNVLPGASVGNFDSVAAGSPLVTDNTGLAVAPQALLEAYAAGLAFPAPPAPAAPLFGDDGFAKSLRDNIANTASSLGAAVTLRQQHTPVRIVGTLRTAGGKGALVFGVLERKDTLTEKSAGSLQVNDVFRILSGKTTVDKQAVLTALEFVVWQVPASGPAVAVAAADQATAASGS
jgi:hypothetical protein